VVLVGVIAASVVAADETVVEQSDTSTAEASPQFELVWSDEFDVDGPPNEDNWSFERGFVRNEELQWYQPGNARCKDGLLVIEAWRQRLPNPRYDPDSRDWRRQREFAEYTSASLRTRRKHEWRYGRFEMRARIDTRPGMWPAFWTLGSARGWPACGEIDIMEYYRGDLLANAAWGGRRRWRATWDTVKKPIAEFDDPQWSETFHVWRMDWDADRITIYVDDELLNEVDVRKVANRDRVATNPFREPHYILVNLAIGGTNGGDPAETEFPALYEIDYVRVYQADY
jgi:beta-glucanase (GH16 family)